VLCQLHESAIAIRLSRSQQAEDVRLMQTVVATLCDASVIVIIASHFNAKQKVGRVIAEVTESETQS
jgi:hypothetical protein